MFDLKRQLSAEFIGTAVLVCTVIGSGIMSDNLTTDTAVALLGNTVATGAILYVLITVLGPISGAHFNPAVTLAFTLQGDITPQNALRFTLAQCTGGILGCVLANIMFDLPFIDWSTNRRTDIHIWLSEIVATAGLIGTIFMGIRFRVEAVPMLVGLYITAAYWFTSSTSFANPAVTIGRMFSDTFAGIAPQDAGYFIILQLITAALTYAAVSWLLKPKKTNK